MRSCVIDDSAAFAGQFFMQPQGNTGAEVTGLIELHHIWPRDSPIINDSEFILYFRYDAAFRNKGDENFGHISHFLTPIPVKFGVGWGWAKSLYFSCETYDTITDFDETSLSRLRVWFAVKKVRR